MSIQLQYKGNVIVCDLFGLLDELKWAQSLSIIYESGSRHEVRGTFEVISLKPLIAEHVGPLPRFESCALTARKPR